MAEPGCLHDAHFEHLEVSGDTTLTGNVTVDYVVNSDISFSPPTGVSLVWEDNKGGITDNDSLVTSKAITSASALQFDGILSTTDDDSLFILKQIDSADPLNLDGALNNNKNSIKSLAKKLLH